MASILDSKEVAEFSTLIEEAARSTQEGVRFFVEPADGTLRRAMSRRHHLIFGRRGSGKSSLLRKAAADLTVDRRPIAWVDLEPFKGHAYPDLLLSVLISTLKAFRIWLESAATAPANKTSFWQKLFGRAPSRAPFDKKACENLKQRLDAQISELERQLHLTDAAEISTTETNGLVSSDSANLSGRMGVATMSVSGGITQSSQAKASSQLKESYVRSKVEFLKRHIIDYQRLFDDLAKVSDGDSYVLLDDLYHIRRNDQAPVIDYLHSIGKGHNLWIKVGTIRHRTRWYLHGNPPVGLKLGDDADEVNLDLTLEKYETAKTFLLNVLKGLANDCSLDLDQLVTPGAIDRMVLASGGVARDLLGIMRRSIDVARERADKDRRPRIDAEDVNIAAGEYDTTKRDEFKRDTYNEDQADLNELFQQIADFCLDEANANCFLVKQDAKGSWVDAINELVDLKLLHRIRSRVTVNTATQRGQLFEAYMLDLSQYAGARKRRGLEIIEFWREGTDNRLRRASLIFEPPALTPRSSALAPTGK